MFSFPERGHRLLVAVAALATLGACKVPDMALQETSRTVPNKYRLTDDTLDLARLQFQQYFADPYLSSLIDTALAKNQELSITSQEILVARNEIRARRGEYLPTVSPAFSVGIDRVPRFTPKGAVEEGVDIRRDNEIPNPIPDIFVGVQAGWEIDIWRRLRNAKDAAVNRYLASVEGRSFVVTNLVGEIAANYYELLALDNQLEFINSNIAIQTRALEVVRIQKEAARVTELAVQRFQAQLLNTQSLQYDVRQRIVETENRINFLTGRYPSPVQRDPQGFNQVDATTIVGGIPSRLLANRADIRQREYQLKAANLDVAVARANYYPRVGLSAVLGYQAFNPAVLFSTPQSILGRLAGDFVSPLVNRNGIIAGFNASNAQQVQAVTQYEQTVLNAYLEVANQFSNVDNLNQKYQLKLQQVAALDRSVEISNELFKSARADYSEVLLTQREALEARIELNETKLAQLEARVSVYRALGGGWQQ